MLIFGLCAALYARRSTDERQEASIEVLAALPRAEARSNGS
jgi:hypothetical protein